MFFNDDDNDDRRTRGLTFRSAVWLWPNKHWPILDHVIETITNVASICQI